LLAVRGVVLFTVETRRTEAQNPWRRQKTGSSGKVLWSRRYTIREVINAVRDSGLNLLRLGGVFSIVRPVYTQDTGTPCSWSERTAMSIERRLLWNRALARRAKYLIVAAGRSQD
ncbi:MAG: hypothetical protein HXY34_01510, partial [Candidatus Thorarchaeota archaeon]|nr:hypothetical protein [Candidatus Thorarchaeota archaeon]